MSRGLAAKRRTTGTSVLSDWVMKKAATVATTNSAKTAWTRRLDCTGGKVFDPSAGRMRPMRVQLVDPPAYTPPYDYSLAGALARAGTDVELSTSRYLYGPAPPADGFRVREDFYRHATNRARGVNARRALRALEHVPDMVRHSRTPPDADIVHYQWLTLEALDAFLLARDVPRVFTSHNVLRRGHGRLRQQAARLVARHSDAIVVHTESGARELVDRFDADPARVHVIPHGAFDYLTRQAERKATARGAARRRGPGDPVVRRAAPLQGRGGADRGLPRAARAPSCGSSGARGWLSSR